MPKYLKREGYSLYYFDQNNIVTTEKMQLSAQLPKSRGEIFSEDWAKHLNEDIRCIKSAIRKLQKGDSYEHFLYLIELSKESYEKLDALNVKRIAKDARIAAKELTAAELVGNCIFDIVSVKIDGNSVPERIETDFLVYDYTFEDVKKMQNEILTEVVHKLKESKNSKDTEYLSDVIVQKCPLVEIQIV